MKRGLPYILCSMVIVATNINGNSVRLTGMGSLRYVIQDYNNEFNFFDFAQNPADLVEDDSARTVVRGTYTHGIGSKWTYLSNDYDAELAGFYRNNKTCVGSKLGYRYYSVFDYPFQVPFGSISLAQALGRLRSGITVGGDQWFWRDEHTWEKHEDNITIDVGVLGVPFTFEKRALLKMGVSAGYQKGRRFSFSSIEGEGTTKEVGAQLLYTLSHIANFIVSANTVSDKEVYQSDTIPTWNSSSQNLCARYEQNLCSKYGKHNLNVVGEISFIDIWRGEVGDTSYQSSVEVQLYSPPQVQIYSPLFSS